ncbi:MAG: hypothetical protein ACAH80_15460 [Alphaproteobacteria bacterium]
MADDKNIIIVPGQDDKDQGSGLVIPSLSDVLNLRAKKLTPAETAYLLKSEASLTAMTPDTRPEIVTSDSSRSLSQQIRDLPVPSMMAAFTKAFPPLSDADRHRLVVGGPVSQGKLYGLSKPVPANPDVPKFKPGGK